MRNPHVWNLLALHVPNLLPRSVFRSQFPRHAGRLIWATIIFTIGLDHRVHRAAPAEAIGRARDLGRDLPRRAVCVGDVRARLRRHPARVVELRRFVPQLRQLVVPAAQELGAPVRHHARQVRRLRRGRHLRASCSRSTSSSSSRGRSARSSSPSPKPKPNKSRQPPAAECSPASGARSAHPRTAVP